MKNRYLLLPLVILGLVCAFLAGSPTSSNAQASPNGFAGRINNYIISPSSPGSYNTIVGQSGTNEIYNPNCGGCGYTYGYTNYTTFSAPFTFNYDSVQYPIGTTMYMYWCGRLGFGSSNPNGNYEYGNGAGYSNFPNEIFPWGGTYLCCWQYNWYDSYGYSGGLYTQVTGTVGNRVLTMEWHGFGLYGYYAAYYGYMLQGMQIKLYEANNNIEFYYSNLNYYMYYGYSPSVGINGGTSPSFQTKTVTTGSDYNFSTYYTPSQNYQFQCPHIAYNIQMSATPKIVNFPSTLVTSSTTANVNITNVGTELTQPLVIQSTSITGNPDFTVVSTPGPLAAGQSGNLVVQFAPIAQGARSAVLTIKSTGRDSGTQTISLLGNGLAALLSTDTNILFKKHTTKMGQSQLGKIAVTNYGGGPMAFSSFAFSGIDSGQYSVVRTPVNPLPPGATDTLGILYTPTIEGRHSATVTINSNALNYPSYPIQLIGTAILPHIVVTPNPLRFDSTYEGVTDTAQITISNPGTDTLIISPNMLSSNDGDFRITALTGSDTSIPPEKSKVVNVYFKPLQRGSRQASYFLKTNIIKTFEPVRRDTAGTVVVPITGNGVPYGMLAQTLAANTYDTVILGDQVCRMDTIWNNGDADLTVTSATISGANSSIFTMTGITFPLVIKSHTFATFNVCGTPTTKGGNTATLTVSGTSNSKVQKVTSSLNIYALNVCETQTPTALFVSKLVDAGTTDTECVTVNNCGQVPAVYTVKLPANATQYSVSPAQSQTVAPGNSATFCVVFSPSGIDSTNSSLTISAPNLKDVSVPLTGIGACATLTASQATYPPSPSKGGKYVVTIPVTNTGNADWTPGTGTVGNQQPSGSTAFGTVTVTPNPIPAGGNGTITVTFNPDQISQTYSGVLSFNGSAPTCASLAAINLSVQTNTESVQTTTEQNGFVLGQNHPNPFGTTTTFEYTTPTEAPVTITVSDLTGRVIRTLAQGRISAGEHSITLDAMNFASGTYIVTLSSDGVSLTRQMVVVK